MTKSNLKFLGISVTEDNRIFHTSTRGKVKELNPTIAHKNKQFYAVVGFVHNGTKYTFYAKNVIYCWHKGDILQGEDIIITDYNPLNWNDLSKLRKVKRTERKIVYEP